MYLKSQSLRNKWVRSGLLVCGLKAKSPRLSPEGSLFDCYISSLAGWEELFGSGDVVGWIGVRGGLGLTRFFALKLISVALRAKCGGSSLRSE